MRRARARRAALGAAALALAGASAPATALAQAPAAAPAGVLEGPGFAGYAVEHGADLNGDGHADLVVGAPSASPDGVPDAGAVYVAFGPRSGAVDLTTLGARGSRIDGFEPGGNLGRSIAHGDVNADGIDDLVITAPALGTGGDHPSPQGGTYVVLGRRDFPRGIDVRALGGHGFAIDLDGTDAASGDVNGDGIDDVIVGAANFLDRDGLAVVVFGRSGPPGDVDVLRDIFRTLGATGYFRPAGARGYWLGPDLRGRAAVGLETASGDVDGDGIDDVILGAPESSHRRRKEGGSVLVAYGRPTAESTILPIIGAREGLRILGARAGDRAGRGIAAVDLDGDGTDEIVVGAPGADGSGRGGSGEVFVVEGRRGRPSGVVDLARWWEEGAARIVGGNRGEEAGTEVAGGDLDGDGVHDLLVGAPYASRDAMPLAGRVYAITDLPARGQSLDLGTAGTGARELYLGDGAEVAGIALGATDASPGRPAQVLIGAPLAGTGSIRTLGRAYVVAGDAGTPVGPAPSIGPPRRAQSHGQFERVATAALASRGRSRRALSLTPPRLRLARSGHAKLVGTCSHDQGCMARVEITVVAPAIGTLTLDHDVYVKVYRKAPGTIELTAAVSDWSRAWRWLTKAGQGGRTATARFTVHSIPNFLTPQKEPALHAPAAAVKVFAARG